MHRKVWIDEKMKDTRDTQDTNAQIFQVSYSVLERFKMKVIVLYVGSRWFHKRNIWIWSFSNIFTLKPNNLIDIKTLLLNISWTKVKELSKINITFLYVFNFVKVNTFFREEDGEEELKSSRGWKLASR